MKKIKLVHWLFYISVLLFIASLLLVLTDQEFISTTWLIIIIIVSFIIGHFASFKVIRGNDEENTDGLHPW
ncbi:MAG: hypothetical protein HOA61_14420 [Bacteroidetes bacterium]|jgi:general stress protein CsbA|nr:hypothetical protein [Bacteroidota bacterium]